MTIGEHVAIPVAFDAYHRFRSYVCVEENVGAFFLKRFLDERGWRAVVVSEEMSPAEAHEVAAACLRYGFVEATALDIDHFDSGFFYKIRLNATSLTRLEETFVTPSYLVVENEERFMTVSDSDHYWSIAGPPSFLQAAFGKPLDILDQEFIEATRNYRCGTSRIGRLLTRIAAEAIGKPIPAA